MTTAAYDPGMRRFRRHRLTGSTRRLLVAAILGGLAAAVAATAASGSAAAGDVSLNLGLSLPTLNASLPPIPSLLPLPTATPPLPTSLANGSVPGLCPPLCSPTPGTGNLPNPSGNKVPANIRTTAPGGSTSGSQPGASSFSGSGQGFASTAGTVGAQQSVGLAVAPPPPVDQLTPLAGISFGKAPYLWPLFLLLDVIAAGAVVLLVRRTWSQNRGAD